MFQMVNAGVRPFGLFPTQLKLAKLMANDNFIDKLPEKISAKFRAVLMGMLNKNVKTFLSDGPSMRSSKCQSSTTTYHSG